MLDQNSVEVDEAQHQSASQPGGGATLLLSLVLLLLSWLPGLLLVAIWDRPGNTPFSGWVVWLLSFLVGVPGLVYALKRRAASADRSERALFAWAAGINIAASLVSGAATAFLLFAATVAGI